MTPTKMILFLSILSSLVFTSSAFAITSSATSESSDSTSTTSGSIKRLFSQNEKERLRLFVDHNFERLEEDAARGSGVTLSDYVILMGCGKSQDLMTMQIKKNYQQLFNGGKSELVHQTEKMMNGDAQLALACDSRS